MHLSHQIVEKMLTNRFWSASFRGRESTNFGREFANLADF